MQEMMRQMESLTDNGDFQNMLEGMMSQLMSKDLLYEPMKDLAAKVSDSDDDPCCRIPKINCNPRDPFDEKDEKQANEVVDLMQKVEHEENLKYLTMTRVY
jgi:peroxin-19